MFYLQTQLKKVFASAFIIEMSRKFCAVDARTISRSKRTTFLRSIFIYKVY